MSKTKILLRYLIAAAVVAVLFVLLPTLLGGADVYATWVSLLPPVIAITLALITKEVYSSLFVGIVSGALIYSKFDFLGTVNALTHESIISSLVGEGNVGILVFLVVLGIIVALVNKAGGSGAYGRWAARNIKRKGGALGATFGLGVLIFIDDYFNCLTVGSVMRPVTDAKGISRAKLAYIIDATAAPVCMIAPISSWAAAVSGMVEGTNGITLFCNAIPYNFYSLLTIVMILSLIFLRLDYGPMRRAEALARKGDLYGGMNNDISEDNEEDASGGKGKVLDLILPVVILIVCCVLGILYTGYAAGGTDILSAFENCDPYYGLAAGSLLALVLIFLVYVLRGVLSFKSFMAAIPVGFKAMVPAILILTFAWSLNSMTGMLGADVFVAGLIDGSAGAFQSFLPAMIFLIAIGLSFSTGTSWGTFGILIPIIVKVAGVLGPELMIISISACLAGAVCGDHCSPISDTTIMSSSGARCNHIQHVSTQLPYSLTVAAVSLVGYIFAGFVRNAWIVLPVMAAVMVCVLVAIKMLQKRSAEA